MTALLLFAWCVGLTAFAAPFPELIDPRVRADLSNALDTANMTVADLGFLKDVGEPRRCLEWSRRALRDPLIIPIRAQHLADALGGSADLVWRRLPEWLEVEAVVVKPPAAGTFPAAPGNLSIPLGRFIAAADAAARELDAGLAALSTEERQYLALALLSEAFDLAQPRTVAACAESGFPTQLIHKVAAAEAQTDRRVAAEAKQPLLQKVERGRLLAAGHLMAQAVDDLRLAVATITNWPDRVETWATPLGPIVIGTRMDDRYDESALLILDPAGDDNYRNKAGAAVGPRGSSIAVILDLDGDDDYRSGQLIGPGAALAGVTVLMDLAGNDRYTADYAGEGSAVLGNAILFDLGGDDHYRAGGLAQGAAILGIGWLQDAAGHDVYEVGKQGQAFAGLFGAGLLADLQGNDKYFAGGAARDIDRNDDRFQSLAQGFSIGDRPFWGGGIAALYDGAGDDTYLADVFGQGTAYWYAAGFLLDAGGHDLYRAYQYVQGAGIHLAVGLLADLAGNDVYIGGILAQAAAHDYAIGMLFDRAGSDAYQADSSSQGRAMNNGFALLVERSGDDRYNARETNSCQGIGNEGLPRDYGALGLLIDQGGRDIYSAGAANGRSLERPLYGVIHDIEVAP